MIAALRRAIALYKVRSLEIQLAGQCEAMQLVECPETRIAISLARIKTSAALLQARQRYIGLLPPGNRPIWKTA